MRQVWKHIFLMSEELGPSFDSRRVAYLRKGKVRATASIRLRRLSRAWLGPWLWGLPSSCWGLHHLLPSAHRCWEYFPEKKETRSLLDTGSFIPSGPSPTSTPQDRIHKALIIPSIRFVCQTCSVCGSYLALDKNRIDRMGNDFVKHPVAPMTQKVRFLNFGKWSLCGEWWSIWTK